MQKKLLLALLFIPLTVSANHGIDALGNAIEYLFKFIFVIAIPLVFSIIYLVLRFTRSNQRLSIVVYCIWGFFLILSVVDFLDKNERYQRGIDTGYVSKYVRENWNESVLLMLSILGAILIYSIIDFKLWKRLKRN